MALSEMLDTPSGMTVAFDDTKHSAMQCSWQLCKRYKNCLATEQKLLSALSGGPEISDRLNDFLKDDQQSLSVIELLQNLVVHCNPETNAAVC